MDWLINVETADSDICQKTVIVDGLISSVADRLTELIVSCRIWRS